MKGWTQADIDEYKRKHESRSANPAPNVEQSARNEPLAKKEGARFNTPVCIHIHSVRKRLCDADGISGKAAIDGLVKAGILKDDSPSEVEQVTFSQRKCEEGEEELTEITIEQR
jgi:hypothetical protein